MHVHEYIIIGQISYTFHWWNEPPLTIGRGQGGKGVRRRVREKRGREEAWGQMPLQWM